MGNLDYIFENLQKHGLRKTKQRIALLKTLHKLKNPSSIETIFQNLPDGTCDLATVYRSLQQLEDIHIVDRTYFSNGAALFALKESGHHHSHHIQCTKCEKLVAIDSCFLKESTQQLKKMGFQQITHRLEFFGVCERCA